MLVFMDGFDTVTSSTDLATKWNIAQISSTSTGRFGSGKCINMGGGTNNIRKNVTGMSSGIISFAVAMLTANSSGYLLSFNDGTSAQCSLMYNVNGTFTIQRGVSTNLATSTATLATGVWGFLEVKYRIATSISSGDFVVRLNGTTIIDLLAGTNTAATGTTNCSSIQFGMAQNIAGCSPTLDDVIFMDLTGNEFNDFQGPLRIQTLLPSGNGNYSQWTNSAGNSTNNNTYVNEATANGDTTYVSASTSGLRDSYAFQDTPTNTTFVRAVATNIVARKTDVSLLNVRTMTRMGGTDYESSDQALPDSYINIQTIATRRPSDNTSWTKADVDAAEFGVRIP